MSNHPGETYTGEGGHENGGMSVVAGMEEVVMAVEATVSKILMLGKPARP